MWLGERMDGNKENGKGGLRQSVQLLL